MKLFDILVYQQPGGSLFVTTLNKTIPMWLGGVLLGEYVFKLAPVGTHHWNKMISPLDVQRILDTSKFWKIVKIYRFLY